MCNPDYSSDDSERVSRLSMKRIAHAKNVDCGGPVWVHYLAIVTFAMMIAKWTSQVQDESGPNVTHASHG